MSNEKRRMTTEERERKRKPTKRKSRNGKVLITSPDGSGNPFWIAVAQRRKSSMERSAIAKRLQRTAGICS